MNHDIRDALREMERKMRDFHDTSGMVPKFYVLQWANTTREALAALDREGARLRGITDGSPECECHRCIREHGKAVEVGDITLGLISSAKMILCGVCGNKRCPQATDHRLACTNSNEPGQEGSVYGVPLRSCATPPAAEPHDESQCWELCGDLGKSAEHARPAPHHPELDPRKLRSEAAAEREGADHD